MNATINFLIEKILSALRNQQPDTAELFLKQAIKIQPKNAELLRLMGVVLAFKKEYHSSLDYLNLANKNSPKNPAILNNLANVYLEIREYNLAKKLYEQSLLVDPRNVETWFNMGKLLYEMGLNEVSLQAYDEALILNQNFQPAHLGKALTLARLNQTKEAQLFFNQAIKLNPSCTQTKILYANFLQELKKYNKSLLIYQSILLTEPNFAELYLNIGYIYFLRAEYQDAVNSYKKSLSLKPNYGDAWLNLGTTYSALRDYEEAVRCYSEALKHSPSINWVLGIYTHAKMNICQWTNIDNEIQEIVCQIQKGKKIVQPLIVMSLIDDPGLHKKCTDIFIRDQIGSSVSFGLIEKKVKKKIRIAYFSPDFGDHAVGRLTKGLFQNHDRETFEVFGFSLAAQSADDGIAEEIKKSFDKFFEVYSLSDMEITALARENEIDIAVDLAGHTFHSRPRIFNFRVAPIQVNWLGYAGTFGAKCMDYIIADKTVIPEDNQIYFSEKVIYLPYSYLIDDPNRTSSLSVLSKSNFSLPQEGIILCCFNSPYKFNSKVLDTWAKIMHRIDGSNFWTSENNQMFKINLVNEFNKRGITPDRIVFAKKVSSMGDYLKRLSLADIYLDTFPYNAHSTALDALKANVPIVTLCGNAFPSRVTASLLKTMSTPELIAGTLEEYENLVVDLALNQEKLKSIKNKLLINFENSPQSNINIFTKDLENIYKKLYDSH